MRKAMKYEGQSSYVRAVCKKEMNGATYDLFRFTKILHNGTKVTDVKVTHDVKRKRHSHLLHGKVHPTATSSSCSPLQFFESWCFYDFRGTVHSG